MSVQSEQDDRSPFGRQFNAVITSYLDGALSFYAAAEQLAALLRAEHERPRTDDEIKQQRDDIERWGKEAPVVIVHRFLPVVQGRSSADLDKCRTLFEAAMRRVLASDGAA